MAKTRSKKTRKSAPSRSRAASKRSTRKTAKARAKRRPSRPVKAKAELDLKQLRIDLERAVTVLGGRTTRGVGSPTVDEAQERMTSFIASLDAWCGRRDDRFCGSTMVVPLQE